MRLIITRHGETEENLKLIHQGQALPGKLTEKGVDQAKKVALRLKDEKIDYIYSSDLGRSADTAKEIAKFHPNVPIEFVKELRERSIGKYDGKHYDDMPDDIFADEDNSRHGGETRQDMFDRLESFLHNVLKKHSSENILFVAHNGVNKMLTCVVKGEKPSHTKELENLGHTAICVYELNEDNNHKVHLYNCTEHLD